MAKTLTLEEAAQKLGLTPEQFKLNLKTHKDFKNVRPLMGGATMHFRAQDVDELARRLGLGSEPELQLGNAGSDPIIPLSVEDDEQIEIGRDVVRGSGASSGRLGTSSSAKRLPKPGEPMPGAESSDDFIPLSAEPGRSGSGSKVSKRDSDVKLAKKSDSDVKLEKRSGVRTPESAATEEIIDLESEQKRQGAKGDVFELAKDPSSKSGKPSSKTSKPSTQSSGKTKKPVDGSEFEMKLGRESSDEFQLTLADEGSDEVNLGASPRDVSGKKGGSGVKLNKPADSGISLESSSESEFELNLDAASASKIGGPRSSATRKGKKPGSDSDSEFELTLDDSSSELAPLEASPKAEKDIFETDFDIPALDDESASEAVVLEEGDTDLESSDFDVAVDDSLTDADSASEVVELDDDAVEAVEDDEGPSAGEALAGVDDEEARGPVMVGAPAPAKWGALPALVLMPCLVVMFVVSLMGYELVHGMWGYRQPSKPSSAVTRGIASIFNSDSELPKEP